MRVLSIFMAGCLSLGVFCGPVSVSDSVVSDGVVSGSVWYDFDVDGGISDFEEFVQGKRVELVENGVVVSSTVSDESGQYEFRGKPGDYSVRVLSPLGRVLASGSFLVKPGESKLVSLPVRSSKFSVVNLESVLSMGSCEFVVRELRPVWLPDDALVECGSFESKTRLGGVESDVVSKRFYKPRRIILKRGLSVSETERVLVHEAWHWVSFSWSEEKQGAFLDSLGAESWGEGAYHKHPSEVWAEGGRVCSGFGYENSKHFGKLPGGCDTISKWSGFKF